MKHLCPFCEEYFREGHNYCRMCGTHLTAEQGQQGEVPARLEGAEKYYGHCGRIVLECAGRHGR